MSEYIAGRLLDQRLLRALRCFGRGSVDYLLVAVNHDLLVFLRNELNPSNLVDTWRMEVLVLVEASWPRHLLGVMGVLARAHDPKQAPECLPHRGG